jgi:hypothetical protein
MANKTCQRLGPWGRSARPVLCRGTHKGERASAKRPKAFVGCDALRPTWTQWTNLGSKKAWRQRVVFECNLQSLPVA